MDRKSKSLPGTIRRKRKTHAGGHRGGRQRISIAKLFLGFVVLCTALVYTIAVCLFSLSMNVDEDQNYLPLKRKTTTVDTTKTKTTAGGDEGAMERPPPRFLNLWPDDKSSASHLLAGMLVECVAQEGCVPEKNKETIERVLVVRPPGKFGDVVVEYIEAYLKGSSLEVISTTASMSYPFPDAAEDDYYDFLIHVATLPLLLESFDVLSMAAQPTKALLTPEDVLAVAQHLLQWHCRVAAHTRDTPSITLTLDPTMFHPWETEQKLSLLYNQTNNDVAVLREVLVKKTMDHIDEGNAFWKTLLLKKSSGLRSMDGDLSTRVNNMIQQTMKDNGKCPDKFPGEGSGSWFGWSTTPLITLFESLWESSAASGEVLDEN